MVEPTDEAGQSMNEQKDQLEDLNDVQLLRYLAEYFQGIPKEGTKVIAIVGGPASGKGTLAANIAELLGKTAILSTDNYLKGDRDWRRANIEDLGLDPLLKYDPEYLNDQVIAIKRLQEGQVVGIPIYNGDSGIAISQDPDDEPDNSTYKTKIKDPQDFVIVEGDFQFLKPEELDRLVYIDVDDDVRLQNRIYRDTFERGELDAERVKANFQSRQLTRFIPHTLPQREKADIVIKVHALPLEHPLPKRKFIYSYDVILQHQNIEAA